MAAGEWLFPSASKPSLLDGTFIFGVTSWRMSLHTSDSNIGPSATLFSDVTGELLEENGYTSGGKSIEFTLSGSNVVTANLANDPVWNVVDESLVARYAVIYAVDGNVLCYCLLDDTPDDVTVLPGNTLTVAASVDGIFTLS